MCGQYEKNKKVPNGDARTQPTQNVQVSAIGWGQRSEAVSDSADEICVPLV